MTQAEQPTIPDNLWTGATLKDTGKAFQVAIDEVLKFRPELDRDDPTDTAFLTGVGYLLNLADHQLASIRVKGFKRDLPAVTEQVRGELSGLRQRIEENTMSVKDR